MNLIENLDITSTNNLLIIANIVLIILAIFLLVKLRKSIVKHEKEFEPDAYPKKENETDLTGIANIKPEEFNPERFDLNKNFLTTATTPKSIPVEMGSNSMQAPDALSLGAVANDAGILGTDELEDELLEEFDLSKVDSPEIPQPVKQEEKTKEESAIPPEPKITVPEKEEKKTKVEFAVPLEPEITIPETKEEIRKVEFVVTPEPKITIPEKEEKKTKVEFAVPPEPKITVPETKIEFAVPLEPEITIPEKAEEKTKVEFAVPPEPKITIPEKAEEKPVVK
ncbi:MAG: hypothetical protein PHH85_06115, partial [Candidatus Methanoperedens sp.]|nr:hypothetical protein [Candidatus Methanoperedens sp.]